MGATRGGQAVLNKDLVQKKKKKGQEFIEDKKTKNSISMSITVLILS